MASLGLLTRAIVTATGTTVAAVWLLLGAAPASAEPPLPEKVPVAAAEDVIVRFASSVAAKERLAVRRRAGVEHEANLPVTGLQLVDPEPGVPVREAVAALERSSHVLYAEPNVARRANRIPNDPLFAQEWGMDDAGQTVGGTTGGADADIDAPEAWPITVGARGVTTAVIDSGVDFAHPDLAANRWENPGEVGAGRQGNGIDDDANGLIDDVHGWDWVQGDAVAQDENGHGTHVAGTVGARGDDGIGVAGVSWRGAILPLRVLDAEGSGSAASLIAAYGYARQAQIRVVNASLGGSRPSRAERDAIAAAKDTLFVVAAGNEGVDNDATPTYPCAYDLDNVVCVAATGRSDTLASFSNFGPRSVDLAAPGVAIASTWPQERWALLDGTSMATPHVAGSAALAWALAPDASVATIRRALLGSVDPRASLTGLIATGGRLNVAAALAALQPPPPAPPAPEAAPPEPEPPPPAPPPPPPPPPAPEPAPPSAQLPAPEFVVPSGPPAPAATDPPSVDSTRPDVRVRVGRPPSRARALRGGIPTWVRCSESCSVKQELSLHASTAARLRLVSSPRRLVVARARGGARTAATARLRLRFDAGARRRLARVGTLTLRLDTHAVDPAGNRRTIAQRVRLRR